MSTYYQFRCPVCLEQGGFFSRQMWGWGNCDIFANFKFHVAHAHCGALEIVSEHDDRYSLEEEEVRWLERLAVDEHLRDEVWPHASEWQWVEEGWDESHAKWREEFERTLEQHRRETTQEAT